MRLQSGDFNKVQKLVLIRDSKGHKTRYVQFSSSVSRIFREYCRPAGLPDWKKSDFLFPEKKKPGQHAKSSNLTHRFLAYAQTFEFFLEGHSFHSLRHAYAAQLAMNGSHKNADGSADRWACVKKEMTLSAGEFIRRFALHIPPRQFRRVRFYGFLSTAQKKTLERMKELTGTPDAACEPESPGIDETLLKEAADGWDKCKKCSGPMERSGFKERSSPRSSDPERCLLALRCRKATMDNQPKTIQ